MILVITGSRSITDYAIVCAAFDTLPYRDEITVLLSGHQNGKYKQTSNGERWFPTVDLLAERWAKEHGIPVITYLPDWSRGRGDGIIRNKEMIRGAMELAERRKEKWACLAVWDKVSAGTEQCFTYAKQMGGEVTVYMPIEQNV
jgi:hypothetical protein